jgi:predicted transcriptional regulator
MSATSLKLSPELRKRITKLLRGTNHSAHSFMLSAIEQATQREELRRRFGEEAEVAEQETEKSGKAYDAKAVFSYLKARAHGKRAKRPAPAAV